MSTQTPILKKSRTADAIDLTMRDIIMKDLLTSTEIGESCSGNKDFDKLNIYIDYYEFTKKISFNLSINGQPALNFSEEFEMLFVTGNSNEFGDAPYKSHGEFVPPGTSTSDIIEDDTIVEFTLPIEGVDVPKIFSEHKNGYSSVHYIIYAVLKGQDIVLPGKEDARERLMLCKGTIYRTNILYDLTENNINE